MLYLDANATEPLRPAARAAAMGRNGCGGQSVFRPSGRAGGASDPRNGARAGCGHCNAGRKTFVFTSGATEANALAIHALGAGRRILTGATEHDAVRAAAGDCAVIPVDADGRFNPDRLEGLLKAAGPALVCLMAANNETGVRHDIASAAEICARHGAVLHVDAVQAVGRAAADWLGMGAASIAISGHKCGGLMGAGALVMAPGMVVNALIQGGGQEQGRRGGTPSLPAVAGLAAAFGRALRC